MSSDNSKQKPQATCNNSNNNDNNANTANANSTGDKIELKREIGLWSGVGIIVGVIVGSGIFITPQEVFKNAGSEGAAFLVWVFSGVLSLFGALSFAELGTSIADSGGDYSYIHMAYGSLPAFLYLWVTVLIIMPCSNAIGALTFAKYALKVLLTITQAARQLAGNFGTEPPPQQSASVASNLTKLETCTVQQADAGTVSLDDGPAVTCLALAMLLLLLYVNCTSVKYSIRLQSTFTLAKVFALFVLICVGLYYVVMSKGTDLIHRNDLLNGTNSNISSLTLAFYAAIYTFAGWNSLNFVTEELKEPTKSMPKAIALSIGAVTLIYLLANVAYFSVLSRDEILSSETIASTFAVKALGNYQWFMPLSVALSATSGLNGLLFTASRILFVGARQGQLISTLNMVSINHLTPVPAILFLGILSLVYLVVDTNIGRLVNYVVFIEAIFSALAVSTMLRLRYKFPDIPRPIKVSLVVPIIYLLFSAVIVVLPIYESPMNALIGTGILLLGVPVYYLTADWTDKPKTYQDAIDKLNLVTQKLTLSIQSDTDTDKNIVL